MRGYDCWKTSDPQDRPFPKLEGGLSVEDLIGRSFYHEEADTQVTIVGFEETHDQDEDGRHTEVTFEVVYVCPDRAKRIYDWLTEAEVREGLEETCHRQTD